QSLHKPTRKWGRNRGEHVTVELTPEREEPGNEHVLSTYCWRCFAAQSVQESGLFSASLGEGTGQGSSTLPKATEPASPAATLARLGARAKGNQLRAASPRR